MSNMLLYEASFLDVSVSGDRFRISYIRCSPPSRLKPKGTIILLHDFFRTSYQFRDVIDLLAMGGYVTLAPDLPGKPVRAQQRPDRGLNREQILESLTEFMKAIKLEKPAHLVGCGFGASVATIVAVQHPDLAVSILKGSGSSRNRLQDILALSGTATAGERLHTFKQHLTSNGTTALSLADDYAEEYAEAFADPVLLLGHKKAVEAFSASQSWLTHPTATLKKAKGAEQFLDISPEEEPEHFALSVLSFANDRGKEAKLSLEDTKVTKENLMRPRL